MPFYRVQPLHVIDLNDGGPVLRGGSVVEMDAGTAEGFVRAGVLVECAPDGGPVPPPAPEPPKYGAPDQIGLYRTRVMDPEGS